MTRERNSTQALRIAFAGLDGDALTLESRRLALVARKSSALLDSTSGYP
jgi:hypothetical protein